MKFSDGFYIRLTAQDKANIDDLGTLWGCSKSEAIRKAVIEMLAQIRLATRAGTELAAVETGGQSDG